jgi:hypothetical protein
VGVAHGSVLRRHRSVVARCWSRRCESACAGVRPTRGLA